MLTYRQADAYFRHKYLHIKKTEIAKYLGVTEGAVRKLIKKTESYLREYRLAHEKEIKLLEAIFGSCLWGGTILTHLMAILCKGLYENFIFE